MKQLLIGVLAAFTLALPAVAEKALFSPLPEGYQELEYVESDGNQYVDSGYTPYSWDIVRIKSRPLQTDMQFFCARGNYAGGEYYELIMLPDGHMRADTKAAMCTSTGTLTVDEQDYDILADFKGGTVKVNGEPFISNINAGDLVKRGNTLVLFALHQKDAATGIQAVSKSRFYSLSLWDYQAKMLKLKLVPCREIETGKVGVYDLIGQRFILPTNKPGLSGENPLKAGPVARPHAVKLLQWVKTTGSQYIDTGFHPQNTDTMTMRVSIDEADKNDGTFFCARERQGSVNFYYELILGGANGALRMDRGECQKYSGAGLTIPSYGEPHMYKSDFYARTTKVDGKLFMTVDYDGKGEYTLQNSLYLFALHDLNASDHRTPTNYGKMKFFGAKLEGKDGTLKLELFPARDEVTGECGVYDSVSQKFFGFVGIEPVAVGDELCSRYQELEYVESDGNQSLDTGYLPYADDTVWLKTRPLKYDTTYFCARGGVGGGYFEVVMLATGYVRFDTGTSQFSSQNFGGGRVQAPNVDYEMTCDFKSGTLLVDGVEWVNGASADHVQRKSNLWLFAMLEGNNTPNKVSAKQSVRYYALKVFNADGTLRLDLVPCRDRLTGNVGFYDRVGKAFIGPTEGFLSAPTSDDQLALNVDSESGKADLTFASASSARKLYWVYGNADQGMMTNDWENVVEAATVAADTTSLTGLDMPSGFGTSYRVLRAVLGNFNCSSPVFAQVPFVVNINKQRTAANLSFTAAGTPRELYVVWGPDVGEQFESWKNSAKLAEISAGVAGQDVNLQAEVSEALRQSKGFRFILVGTPDDASEYTKISRGLFLVIK